MELLLEQLPSTVKLQVHLLVLVEHMHLIVVVVAAWSAQPGSSPAEERQLVLLVQLVTRLMVLAL
jgi:hypothetical protein